MGTGHETELTDLDELQEPDDYGNYALTPSPVPQRASRGRPRSALQPRELTYEEKEAQRKELARQRKQRERDKAKIAVQTGELSVPRDDDMREDTRNFVTQEPTPRFTLKLPALKKGEKEDAKPVKLFTSKEAEEEIDKLKMIYLQGSKLLDDVLEIVVKGHEKVRIWALNEDEALMLADMQMEQAKHSVEAARVVRRLFDIYDRLYLWMIVMPRMKASGDLIISHGGLSFK